MSSTKRDLEWLLKQADAAHYKRKEIEAIKTALYEKIGTIAREVANFDKFIGIVRRRFRDEWASSKDQTALAKWFLRELQKLYLRKHITLAGFDELRAVIPMTSQSYKTVMLAVKKAHCAAGDERTPYISNMRIGGLKRNLVKKIKSISDAREKEELQSALSGLEMAAEFMSKKKVPLPPLPKKDLSIK